MLRCSNQLHVRKWNKKIFNVFKILKLIHIFNVLVRLTTYSFPSSSSKSDRRTETFVDSSNSRARLACAGWTGPPHRGRLIWGRLCCLYPSSLKTVRLTYKDGAPIFVGGDRSHRWSLCVLASRARTLNARQSSAVAEGSAIWNSVC